MGERYDAVKTSVTTADADSIRISQASSEILVLYFKEYNGRNVSITFQNVLAFKFEMCHTWNHRDDEIYEVKNSNWMNDQIKSYLNNFPLDDVPQVKHYRFCFNVNSQFFDVICSKDFDITIKEI